MLFVGVINTPSRAFNAEGVQFAEKGTYPWLTKVPGKKGLQSQPHQRGADHSGSADMVASIDAGTSDF
jgi:hypothetical protein